MFTECECQNSLEGNVCDMSTGKCGLCRPGFFGDFCKGKNENWKEMKSQKFWIE